MDGRDRLVDGTTWSLRSEATGASSASIGLDIEELAALKDFREEDLEPALGLLLGVPLSSPRASTNLSMERLTGVLPRTEGLGVRPFTLGKGCGSGSRLESVYSRRELS